MQSVARSVPVPDPGAGAAPGSDAIEKAAAAVVAAAGTEETRFNNLNSRAVALISAGSIVVALLAVFGKDLVTGENTVPSKIALTALLVLAAVSLLLAVGWLVFMVLLPGRRYTFGNNRVTSNVDPVTTSAQVFEVQWREYRLILERLTARNTSKAQGLHTAYCFYGAAIFFAVLAVGWAMVADTIA